MISQWLDITLVSLLVAAAITYLIMRKVRALKRIERDWATGVSDAGCDSCPVVKIRQLRS